MRPSAPIGLAAEPIVNQRIKTFHAGGLLALALLGEARAGPLEDAEAAYQRRDYATTLQILGPMADQGDASAQYDLGVIYSDGQGAPQDYAKAAAWFEGNSLFSLGNRELFRATRG